MNTSENAIYTKPFSPPQTIPTATVPTATNRIKQLSRNCAASHPGGSFINEPTPQHRYDPTLQTTRYPPRREEKTRPKVRIPPSRDANEERSSPNNASCSPAASIEVDLRGWLPYRSTKQTPRDIRGLARRTDKNTKTIDQQEKRIPQERSRLGLIKAAAAKRDMRARADVAVEVSVTTHHDRSSCILEQAIHFTLVLYLSGSSLTGGRTRNFKHCTMPAIYSGMFEPRAS